MIPALPPPAPQPAPQTRETALRRAAEELEAAFLAEMLKSAGLGATRSTLGGGAGEEHFATFAVREHASAMTRAGGIGLAESLYRSLLEHDHVTE